MLSFAIVVPNLNQSRFLPDALESLRYQKSAFELAVMDGGSVDEFENVVERMKI
jgi:glycosyltransferase involved in cell wall biosynthesis